MRPRSLLPPASRRESSWNCPEHPHSRARPEPPTRCKLEKLERCSRGDPDHRPMTCSTALGDLVERIGLGEMSKRNFTRV